MSHESIKMLIAKSAAQGKVVDGAHSSYAYLYEGIDRDV